MSMAALCLATRDTLRGALRLSGGNGADLVCDLAMDGEPHPACGEVFYAIHAGGWSGSLTGDWDIGERMGVLVTVTRRIAYSPQDRRATDAWAKANVGLDALCRVVIKALHQNQAVRAAANVIIGATDTTGDGTPNGFLTALMFAGGSQPQKKYAEWFGSEESNPSACGLAVVLNFGMVDRIQGIAGMT